MINIGEVASFIDNMMVGIEEEEEHDEVIEEVVKKLVENDWCVKSEKYKWNIREVGFLEVVIGFERIKIEEEKIKVVIELANFQRG